MGAVIVSVAVVTVALLLAVVVWLGSRMSRAVTALRAGERLRALRLLGGL